MDLLELKKFKNGPSGTKVFKNERSGTKIFKNGPTDASYEMGKQR